MRNQLVHPAHAGVVKRLRRASGHLQNVIAMMEADRPCGDVAQQLRAVERAIQVAKRVLVHEHLDHCLEDAMQGQPAVVRDRMREFKDITKYL